MPLDGSTLAEAALPIAANVAKRENAVVTLLHVEPPEIEAVTGLGVEVAGSNVVSIQSAYVLRALQTLQTTCSASEVVLHGTPSVEISNFLASNPTDLLVITPHGRGGPKHLVLGSTAHQLVRSGNVVLVVRGHDS